MKYDDPLADCLGNLRWVRKTLQTLRNHRTMQGDDQLFNRGTLVALEHSLSLANPKMRFLCVKQEDLIKKLVKELHNGST